VQETAQPPCLAPRRAGRARAAAHALPDEHLPGVTITP
jgi:hypothetical protein